MLGIKYKDEFLKKDKNKDLEAIMDRIITKEEQYGIDCANWSVEQIEEFLRDLHSISPNTISRSLTYLRNFVGFICAKEKLNCPEYKLEFGKLYDLVDFNKLLNSIITFEQYRHIKNQLDLNLRDKVIFTLAWHLLGNDEIKTLKEKDIEFAEAQDTGMEIAILHLSDTKIIKVEDPEAVEDIKNLINEKYYHIEAKDGKTKRMQFKYSEYLIKPVNVGRAKKEDYISNPSLALQSAIEQQGVTCPDIDVNELSIESIRRSKLIYMLAPQNEKYFDNLIIRTILDSGNGDSNLFWLKKVAKMKYSEK